jgi:hypothetical protein
MLRAATPIVLLLALCVLVAVPLGCSKSDPSDLMNNIPPETHLSFAPAAGDTVCYRVRMNWFGWDPDGEVTHFLTMWDSLGWEYTVATESLFVVSTDDTAGGTDQSYGYHTFSVKAVDNDGDEDPTPASVSFTAENIFPDTEILEGPGDISWPFVTFEWEGSDPDGEIAGFGYRLMFREGLDYVEYASEDSLSPHETVAEFGPLGGAFRFEVWSIDDQGARDATPAEWSFVVYYAGPSQFYVTSNVFGGPRRWLEYPDAWTRPPIPIFDGEHVTFDWSAVGQGIKYRHAYDDTTGWSAWSSTGTHFEVTPVPGEHEMHVAVKDTMEIEIHAHLRFEVVEVGLDDYILIMDDYDMLETNELWGTDLERDAFYDAIVAPFGERYAWDPAEHVIEGSPTPPDVQALADASTVIWYCDQMDATIEGLFDPYGQDYDRLGGYVRAGGNLVLCGRQTLTQVAGEPYPLYVGPGDSTPGGRFIRDVLRIGYVDHSGSFFNPDAPWDYGYCMHGAIPTSAGEALGFEPAYVDSGDCDVEPGKWFFYCDPPMPGFLHSGLPVEKLENFQGTGLEIYATDSFLNENYEGETSAVLYLSGDNRGNVCYLGFPLYYLQTPQAEALLQRVLALFGEEER